MVDSRHRPPGRHAERGNATCVERAFAPFEAHSENGQVIPNLTTPGNGLIGIWAAITLAIHAAFLLQDACCGVSLRVAGVSPLGLTIPFFNTSVMFTRIG
jgi:hypothetical protein